MSDFPAASRPFVFSVTLMIPNKSGLVWWPCCVEYDAALTETEAMDRLHQELVEDGSIRVTKFVTIAGAAGERIVTEKVPTIIGAAAVATITPIHVRVRDQVAGVVYEPA